MKIKFEHLPAALLGAASLWSSAHAAAPLYTITTLPTPEGYQYCIAEDMNERDQVVGNCTGGSPWLPFDRPFVWSPGTGLRFLPEAPDAPDVFPRAINDAGEIAGTLYFNGLQNRAFKWSLKTGYTVLSSSGPVADAYATDINNAGYVVGSDGCRAALWTPENAIVDLFAVEDGCAQVEGISRTGYVTGYWWSNGDLRGGSAIRTPSGATLPIKKAPGFIGMRTYTVNNSGIAAGAIWVSDGAGNLGAQVAAISRKGAKPVSVHGIGDNSLIVSINDAHQAVGQYSSNLGDVGGFYWDKESGMVKLQDLIDREDAAGAAVSYIGSGTRITNKGHILTSSWTATGWTIAILTPAAR